MFTSKAELKEDKIYKVIFKDDGANPITLKKDDKLEIEQTHKLGGN